MVGSKGLEPRKKQAVKQLARISEQKGEGFLTAEALELHNQKIKVNDKFFKQPQAVFSHDQVKQFMGASKELDKTIDRFFRSFCKALIEDASKGLTDKDDNLSKGIANMVDRYGKENPGFINYSEFKDLFGNHAAFIIEA